MPTVIAEPFNRNRRNLLANRSAITSCAVNWHVRRHTALRLGREIHDLNRGTVLVVLVVRHDDCRSAGTLLTSSCNETIVDVNNISTLDLSHYFHISLKFFSHSADLPTM